MKRLVLKRRIGICRSTSGGKPCHGIQQSALQCSRQLFRPRLSSRHGDLDIEDIVQVGEDFFGE
jgi:hypothetical protein